MRHRLSALLPICLLALIFTGVYIITKPKVELPEFAEINSALTVLKSYGYESRQIVLTDNNFHVGLCFAGFVLSVLVYFYIYNYQKSRKILKFIDYVRQVNDKVYNLKLDENDEGELSLLANELYKTAVLLQETAELDKQRAQKLETALADISHQLRTPLTSLQITLDNLYENPKLDLTTRQEFLRLASRQIKQTSELAITLLNVAKLDNGTLKLQPQELIVADLIDEVIEYLAILAELHQVTVRRTGDHSAKATVDRKWQTQALINIVKNCIEHSQSGANVVITTESNAVFTRLIIRDTGEGIDNEDLHHIFERFYQAKNSKNGSSGIGLALAKALIEADGGHISATSIVGQGTQFIVTYYKT